VLVILWDPQRRDHPAPPKAAIEQLLFGAKPSVVDWYRENSGGRFTIKKAGVLGWYRADKAAEHYWNKSKDPNDADHDGWLNGHVEKWAEAIRKADREFNFAAFDFNQDGRLTPDELGILIVIPQKSPFGTNRSLLGREIPRKEPLIVDGVRLNFVAECYCGSPPNLGVLNHELSHLFLGTPDMYMTAHWPFAAGDYSIMDHSYTSAHFDPFIKLKLGWLDYRATSTRGEFTLPDVETKRTALILHDPTRGYREYFLLENRWRGSSYDAGVGGAGWGIRVDGLAIWHIIEDAKLFDAITLPTGGLGDWGRRGVRMIRANGGTPFSDKDALFNRLGQYVGSETNSIQLRWLDGSNSRFQVELASPPGRELKVKVLVQP
jgi:M6 family metalloprotease-like protein